MCSWLYHGWVPETISGKPYTHHGCLETIPSLFSKSVPEYLDHLVVTRGGKLHTGKKGGMFWNKLDITPALLVIFLGDKLLESPLKKKKAFGSCESLENSRENKDNGTENIVNSFLEYWNLKSGQISSNQMLTRDDYLITFGFSWTP